MLTLYIRPGCPYCAKVLMNAEILGIPLEQKNVYDPGVREELEARGGKYQVPYLVDAENSVEMYESDAILAYLHDTFTPVP